MLGHNQKAFENFQAGNGLGIWNLLRPNNCFEKLWRSFYVKLLHTPALYTKRGVIQTSLLGTHTQWH